MYLYQNGCYQNMKGGAELCLCLGPSAASNVAGSSLSNCLCNLMMFERSQGSARVSVNWERDCECVCVCVGDVLIRVWYRETGVWFFTEYSLLL